MLKCLINATWAHFGAQLSITTVQLGPVIFGPFAEQVIPPTMNTLYRSPPDGNWTRICTVLVNQGQLIIHGDGYIIYPKDVPQALFVCLRLGQNVHFILEKKNWG